MAYSCPVVYWHVLLFRCLLLRILTPHLVARCSELYAYLQPLGLQAIRTRRLKALSSAYIDDPPSPLRLFPSRVPNGYLGEQRYPPTPVSHLPGSGRYALDSYRIFCMDETNPELEEWKRVKPTDKELIRYLVCWSIFNLSLDTHSSFPVAMH